MILADTDVLIDYLTGSEPVKTQIVKLIQADRLQTSAITCFELLSGAGENKRGQTVRQFLESLRVLALDRAAAQRAAEVRRVLDKSGMTIGMADSLIAGIALTHQLPLFTRNLSHFERIKDLDLLKVGDSI